MTKQATSLPQHIAIIMDGNGRWAQARGLPRAAGHKAGVDAVRRTLEAAKAQGVRVMTLFAFSSENWRRPADEVEGLMTLLRFYLKAELARLHKEGVRLRVIGDKEGLAVDIQEMIVKAEALTAENTSFTLCIALNYGSRQEILSAVKKLAAKGLSDITEEDLRGALYAGDLPDPDLIVRTSGEQRLSNFLLWQAAYAEFYFTHIHWPDFGAEELAKAIAAFANRDRRFGGLNTPDVSADLSAKNIAEGEQA